MTSHTGFCAALSVAACLWLAASAPSAQGPATRLDVFAVPFKDVVANSGVLVYIEIPPSFFREWTFPGTARRLDVVLQLRDAAGMTAGERRHGVNTAFGAESLASLRSLGLRLLTQIPAPPGALTLQVAVTDVGAGLAAGSVPLDIPDFSAPRLILSDLSLYAWPQRPQKLTVVAQVPMAAVLPWAPTPVPVFSRGETIAVFAELYDPGPSIASRDVNVDITLQTTEGRVVARTTDRWASTTLRGRRQEYGFQGQLPLAGVQPGTYTVDVAAAAGDERVERRLQVRIE